MRLREDRLLTVAEVAQILNRSVNTVYHYIQDYGLPAHRISLRFWRIRESELLDWIHEQPQRIQRPVRRKHVEFQTRL